MLVIIDTETEGLISPQKLWVVACKEVLSGKRHVFRNVHEDPKPFQEFARGVTGWIGHNVIQFDSEVLRTIAGVVLDPKAVIDTLVVSRLLNFSIEGGHSLEAWGGRLKVPKSDFHDFSRWSQEIEDYCLQDLEVTHAVYTRFLPYILDPLWRNSLRLEHDISYISLEMTKEGFGFNQEEALRIHQEITLRLQSLDEELLSVFPPRASLVREILPKATKHGTINRTDFRWTQDLSAYTVGSPFSLIEWIPFNPASPRQIVTRLNEAGWRPYEKTKGHRECLQELRWCKNQHRVAELQEKLKNYEIYGWSISEDNLATLPSSAPEASRKLVQRLLLASRLSTLNEWLSAYQESTSSIHGHFNGIGAWTHRMSHSSPNMGNVPTSPPPSREATEVQEIKVAYGNRLRGLWVAKPGRLLVGVDADGIQLRVLAHYMQDERFIASLVSGVKEDGTDAHSLNWKALGDACQSREDAKTFIYAWLLGAGIPKVASILGCSIEEARDACEQFLSYYPGLKSLKEQQIPTDAERGYFKGLDGRLVKCNTEHKMLAGYLQNGESIIMKKANVLWRELLTKERIPFWQVNLVHDEFQTETVDDYEVAKHVAEVQADSIRQVGEDLNLRCPLLGSILNSHKKIAIAKDWSNTH